MVAAYFICIWISIFIQGKIALRDNYRWGSVTSGEYCEHEDFVTECNQGEVIVIEKAVYGHMKLGKCVEVDVGYLGCHTDVKQILDDQCTGKTRCQISVIDSALRNTAPCPRGITVYLDVTYWCVQGNANLCSPLRASAEETFFPSAQVYDKDCLGGSSVTIETDPGQQIVLSLSKPVAERREAIVYGLAVGELNDDEITIEYNGQASSVLGKSKSSKVDIVLDQEYREDSFIIGFRAEGCPNLNPPPPGTTFSHHEDVATVACRDTPQSWQLTCRGVRWIGVIGNCSVKAPLIMESKSVIMEEKVALGLPKDVIFLTIACATLFIAIVVVTVGYVSLRKARLQQQQNGQATLHYDTVQRRSILKQRPNSDYLTPTYPADGQEAQDYEFPLREVPLNDTLPARGTVKRNNEEDYTASLSSNSTDYTRKYYVLDKDYIAVNNINNC